MQVMLKASGVAISSSKFILDKEISRFTRIKCKPLRDILNEVERDSATYKSTTKHDHSKLINSGPQGAVKRPKTKENSETV